MSNLPITTNRSLLEKADLALADLLSSGGLLQPAQAQKFIRLLIDESVLLGMSTVTPMKSPKQLLEKTRFSNRVLRAGTEATPLAAGDRVKPDLSKVELDAQLFKAEVRLDNEVLEDNIEGGTFRQTVMSMLSEAIARDMDEMIVNGDTASADTFLAKFDGVLKQATSNIVDNGGAPIDRPFLANMLKAMPSEFLRNKKVMRFLTSVDAEIDYREGLGDRATVAGDRFALEDTAAMAMGVPVEAVPLFPEDLGVGNNETDVLLTDPKNINVGIWRNIRIETDKLISEGVMLIVATLRFDCKFEEETAVVKGIGVTVS